MTFLYINIFIGLLGFIIREFTPSKKDVFQSMEEMNKSLEGVNEDTKNIILNTIDLMMENKVLAYLIIFLISSIPIINLILLYDAIKEYKEFKEGL